MKAETTMERERRFADMYRELWDDEAREFDHTTGEVQTPNGPAKWIAYDSTRKTVLVEQASTHLVEYKAEQVFLVQ